MGVLLAKAAALFQHGALSFVGSTLAVGSAAFAGYMMINTPETPYFGGLQHLAIFAQPSGAQTASPGEMASARERLARDLAQMKNLDMTPIGTIPKAPAKPAAPSSLPVSPDYALISLVGRKALVRSADGVRLYDRGDAIGSIGKFTAVERFGQGWSLVTEKARILEPPAPASASSSTKAP